NKMGGARDDLFNIASEALPMQRYRTIIRIAIDDDDMFLPWFFQNLEHGAELAREVGCEIVGLGMENFFLVSKENGQVICRSVESDKKFITGNKFYVFFDTSLANLLSPWSFPD